MKNMQNFTLGLAGVTLALSLAACGGKTGHDANAKDTSATVTVRSDEKEPRPDDKFAMAAADGGLYEVELGKLALSKGTSADVKQLAQMMVTDHGKMNDQLKMLAQRRNIVLPGTMSTKSQSKYDQLAKKTGAEFNKEYALEMVAAHQEDIDAFKKEAEGGQDQDVKSWADGELPMLQHHLELANYTLHPGKK